MFVPILVVAYVGYVVRLPYFVIGPGPASDVEPLIHVQGHATYQSKGHLLLTAISFYQPNAYEALGAWLSSSEAVIPRDRRSSRRTARHSSRCSIARSTRRSSR